MVQRCFYLLHVQEAWYNGLFTFYMYKKHDTTVFLPFTCTRSMVQLSFYLLHVQEAWYNGVFTFYMYKKHGTTVFLPFTCTRSVVERCFNRIDKYSMCTEYKHFNLVGLQCFANACCKYSSSANIFTLPPMFLC